MAEGYDTIIIGAGPAGCVLANRLSEDQSARVLLLEAGGADKNWLFHIPAGFAKMTKGIASWGWQTVPQKHLGGRVLWYTQAKVLGGGSSINAQLYNRGNRRDYDLWCDEGGFDGWRYRDVLPYFKRSEGHERLINSYHNTTGPLGVSYPRAALPVCDAFIQAGQQWGLPHNGDFNGRDQLGIGYYHLTQRDAARSSAAKAFLRPVMNRPNLAVRTGVQVTKIIVEAGQARAVEIVAPNTKHSQRIDASGEILLASGAIGSPRLLLLSGIGPAGHLKSLGITTVHDLPGVGENLQDHLDLCTIFECSGDHSYDGMQKFHRTLWAGLQYFMFRRGPAASSLFETGGFAQTASDARSPDIQFHFGQGSGIEKGIAKLDNPGVTLNSAYLHPQSRGTVKLASADPQAPPLIDPNYWSADGDRKKSMQGLEMAREIMRQPALEPFLRREVLPGAGISGAQELFDYACRMAKTDHHPVGTCKMGLDEMAVVDPELRVRGLEKLRVCDSAIMPIMPSANTCAPTLMVGEKAADLVLGKPPLTPIDPTNLS